MNCGKNPKAIQECIRRSENVSISLYRGDATPMVMEVSSLVLEQPPSPLGHVTLTARRLTEAFPPLTRQAEAG